MSAFQIPVYRGRAFPRPLRAPGGEHRVSNAGVAPSYRAGVTGFTPQVGASDIVAFQTAGYGVSGRLMRVKIVARSATDQAFDILLQRAPNGGGGTSAPLPVARGDVQDVSASCVVSTFSVNRSDTQGYGISSTRPIICSEQMVISGGASNTVEMILAADGVKGPTVKDPTNWIVLSLNKQTLAAVPQFDITFSWVEEKLAVCSMFGDSLTSNAFPGYLNGGANIGGMGSAGTLNSRASFLNHGSNGFRLYDAIFNTNGVTYSLNAAQATAPDIMVLSMGMNDERMGLAATEELTCLIDTAIYSVLNGTTANQVYVSPKATAKAISAMTWSGSVVTVQTSAAHGWQVGGTVNVQISGCTPSGYNGYYAITVVDATHFTYALVSNPGAATVLGTASYAVKFPAANQALPACKIILHVPNGVTADDAGDGTYHYLSSTGDTNLHGLWTGLTLAQAATSLTQALNTAYQAFSTDARLFAFVNQQDLQITSPVDGVTKVYAFPSYHEVSVRALADIPNTATKLPTMTNQLHKTAWGKALQLRQIEPYIVQAIDQVADLYV